MKDPCGIAVAGTALVDRINEISAYPQSGELTQIASVSRAVGGCVPNVAIDLARIDPTLTVRAIARVGRDGDGDFIVNTMAQNGVDMTFVRRVEDTTSFTDVMSIRGGQRTFFTYAGACASFGYDDIDFEHLNVKMLHLGYFLLLDKVDAGEGKHILQNAKEHGIVTSLDMVSENSDRYHLVRECLPYTDNLIINETEAGMLAGLEPTPENLPTIAQSIKNMGVCDRIIIHTPALGICLSGNGYVSLPSYDLPVDFIRGTTGAGDAFCAGALLGIYRELDDLSILTLASKAAVASLSAADSISGLRTEDELNRLCAGLNRKS